MSKSDYGRRASEGWTGWKCEENYKKIFGSKCSVCNGLGYFWEKDQNGNPIKINCLLCNSKGEKPNG